MIEKKNRSSIKSWVIGYIADKTVRELRATSVSSKAVSILFFSV